MGSIKLRSVDFPGLTEIYAKLKNIGLPMLDTAYLKVLYWFFAFPDAETGLNDISSDLKISKTTAKNVIEELIEAGFITKKIYGKAWRMTFNKNKQNYSKKIGFNLNLILMGYVSLRQEIVKKVGNFKSVILFGSYRKGDDTEKSDIDIAVEVSDNKDVRMVQLGIIPKFGFRKNVPVNLYIFSRNKIDINLFSNIANGIVLEGFLEVRP